MTTIGPDTTTAAAAAAYDAAVAMVKRASEDSNSSDSAQPTRVIFLDIDGVLNRTRMASHIRLEDDLVENLRLLVEKTDAKIVLSTFWRHFQEYIQYILHRHGLPADVIIGQTPGTSEASMLSKDPGDPMQYADRASEIHAWLRAHPTVISFVILDDRASASDDDLASQFVHTVSAHGLTAADAERARAIVCDWGPRAILYRG